MQISLIFGRQQQHCACFLAPHTGLGRNRQARKIKNFCLSVYLLPLHSLPSPVFSLGVPAPFISPKQDVNIAIFRLSLTHPVRQHGFICPTQGTSWSTPAKHRALPAAHHSPFVPSQPCPGRGMRDGCCRSPVPAYLEPAPHLLPPRGCSSTVDFCLHKGCIG